MKLFDFSNLKHNAAHSSVIALEHVVHRPCGIIYIIYVDARGKYEKKKTRSLFIDIFSLYFEQNEDSIDFYKQTLLYSGLAKCVNRLYYGCVKRMIFPGNQLEGSFHTHLRLKKRD